MNKYRNLISNTFIFAIGTFSSKVLVFLLMPLYTKVLSEAQYGTVDLMVQVGNFLLPLVSCGIVNGIIRFGLDKYYKKRDVFTTRFPDHSVWLYNPADSGTDPGSCSISQRKHHDDLCFRADVLNALPLFPVCPR